MLNKYIKNNNNITTGCSPPVKNQFGGVNYAQLTVEILLLNVAQTADFFRFLLIQEKGFSLKQLDTDKLSFM